MTTQPEFLKALVKIGSEWKKGAMHRVYFNDLHLWYGLEFETYNSGNISSATLNGDEISNGRACNIISTLASAKVWYDVEQARFFGRDIDNVYLKPIVAAIKARVEALVVEADEQEICR